MGIIRRQGSKTLLVNYGGALVGALAVLFVYSSNDEIYGYAHWLFSTASLLLPLASLGILSLIIKFYPIYSESDSRKYNGFLSLILLLLGLAFIVFLLMWHGLTPYFYKFLIKGDINYELFQEYEFFILSLVLLLVLQRFLTAHASNRLRIVVPNLVTQFGYKVYLPIIILLYAWYDWTIYGFSWAIIAFFALTIVILSFYLVSLDAFHFGMIRPPGKAFRYSELSSFAFYGILNQLGNTIAMRVDSVMIPILLGSTSFNSYYIKAFFIANFIEMPTRSLNAIASPIISKAWKDGNTREIKMIYQKASNNLFLAGAFIFIGIWYCLDDLVAISSDPDSFPHVRIIFLLLGMAKLIDMLTSVNSYIIGFSKLYRYNLLFLLFLATANILLNYNLISSQGISGAAMATSLSILLFNLLKLGFIWRRFSMLPFTYGTTKTLALFVVLFSLYFVIDFGFHPLINILIKGLLVSLIYLPIAYFWKISPDVNESIEAFLNKLKA